MANRTDTNTTFGQKYGNIKLDDIINPTGPIKKDDWENKNNTEDKDAFYFLSLVLVMLGLFFYFKETITAFFFSTFL